MRGQGQQSSTDHKHEHALKPAHEASPSHSLPAICSATVSTLNHLLSSFCSTKSGAASGQASRMACTPLSHGRDRKSTRLNSSHVAISYAVFCLKKKTY